MTVWFLVAALVAGFLTLLTLMFLGRLTLDLRWGRSLHPLGPIVVSVEAPRELVFEQLSSPYLGRTPREAREHLEVLERGESVVLALHRTPVAFYTAETVETVRFEAPERVAFRHVRGPVPHAEEEFVLSEDDRGTELVYRGEIGLDLWFVGGLAARFLVRPVWERRVREAMESAKAAAESRAAAGARREEKHRR